MNNLESDIQGTRKRIVECLTAYEKHSQQIISHSFNIRLHTILDAISTFDPEQLKSIQAQVKDQVAIKHLNNISTKMKATATQNKQVASVNPQPAKRQPKIGRPEESKNKESRSSQKKEGFFDSVIKRFASKEKKASQIILPDKEPNCYFDQKRRIWIFQGEEPDLPKQVPKPPSKSQIIKPKDTKQGQQPTEMNSLTAPPEFKRKGTSVNTSKKVKKQMKTVENSEQPLVFAKVIENINKEYQSLLEKVKRGAYQLQVSSVNLNNQNQLTEFVALAEVMLHSSEEVGQQEQKLIQKLNRTFAGEGHQLKLLQKILKEVSESSNIYQRIITNLDSISRQTISRSFRSESNFSGFQQRVSVNFQTQQKQKQLRQQIERLVTEKNSQYNSIAVLQNEKNQLQKQLKSKIQQRDQLLELNFKLKQQNTQNRQMIDQLSVKNAQTNSKIQKSFSQKESDFKKMNQQLIQQNKDLSNKLQNLRRQFQKLQQAKSQVQRNLLILQSNTSNISDKMKDEILKEKAKIQNQLKFYEEKEKSFLKNMKNIQEHTTIIQQFQQTLKQENKLLNAIFQQRLQLAKTNDYEESVPIYHKNMEELTSPHTVILQLSDIISSITQTHLERLESFNRNYTTLSKKYNQAKELNKKIKNSTSSENMSLNRSVSRLKSLIESYKMAKEEAEERSTQLEIQCQKLRKKLEHYKEQDKFNKSYLSKLKNSGINNQSVVSLQQDNEELAQTIEDLQREVESKEQNCIKLQNDLEDILTNYEKTQQKLLNMEKKAKETQKELRILKEEKQSWLSKINLLQVKLANLKEKNQELVQRQAAKIKNIEAHHQKKMKLLRQDLERAHSNQEYLKREIQDLGTQNNSTITKIEESFRQKIAELKSQIELKEGQIGELLLLVQETNKTADQKQQQIAQLKRKNEQLESKSLQISENIQDYNRNEIKVLKQAEAAQSTMVQKILTQFKQYQQQQSEFRNQYEAKFSYLSNRLLQSQDQSKALLQSLNSYSQLLGSLDSKIRQTQEQEKQQKQQMFRLISQLKEQNADLAQSLIQQQEKFTTEKQQKSKLQLLRQQLTHQLQFLKNENIEILRENQRNQTKYNQIQLQLSKNKEVLINNEEEILKNSASISTLKQKIKELEEENLILCNQLENRETQQLKKTLLLKESEILKLKNELQLLASEIEDKSLNRHDVQLHAELDKLREQGQKRQHLINQLKASLRNKQDELIEVTQLFQNFNRDATELEISKKQLQEKYVGTEAQLKQAQLELAQVKVNFANLQSNNILLQQENKNLSHLLHAKNKQLQRAQQEILQQKEKATELISRITQLQQLTRSQKAINQEIEQKKDDEVQGEMQYLLKEIQDRESQINVAKEELALKDQQLITSQKHSQQLKAQIHKIKRFSAQIQTKIEILERQLETKSQETNNLNQEILGLRNQNQQLTELVQSLSKNQQVAQERDSEVKIVQIARLQAELSFKAKALTEIQIAYQQNERLLRKAESQLNQRAAIINDLQGKIAELSQTAQRTHSINQYNKSEEVTNVNQLKDKIITKEGEIAELKKRLNQLNKALSEKENDSENKIQSLERQIISLNSLKVANKKLQEQYRQLQSQNSTLLTEKVELMRSNDNLMKINQKLIIQISPHNKSGSKTAKAPEATQVSPPKQQQKIQGKSQIKQSKVQKQEVKGFLGTLSSFFLTPTETDRLVKK